MTKLFTLLISFLSLAANAQQKLFHQYTDSATLVNDANQVVADFWIKTNAIKAVNDTQPVAILNTRPFLIFYSPKANKVNLPIWRQVIPEQQKFFYTLAGDEKEGQKMFGLFFNGFYLAHELAHALQKAAGKNEPNLYQNEYVANQIAMLYWRKVKRNKELEQCYRYAKKVVASLPSPVPKGEDPIKYFNEHYAELGADPYKYGYYQFAQFVEVYEDKKLGNFDSFVKAFLSNANENK